MMTPVNSFLLKLEKEFGRYAKTLEDAEIIIRNNEVSEYAIFVFSDQPIELGVELVSPEKAISDWYIYAATLETFATKGLITADKIEPFIKTYRKHQQDYCLFAIDQQNSNFVFINKNTHTKNDN